MANTTYQLPLNNPERVVEAMCGVFQHLVVWKQKYNIDFISCIRNGPNLDVTFSDPVPLDERQAIKATL